MFNVEGRCVRLVALLLGVLPLDAAAQTPSPPVEHYGCKATQILKQAAPQDLDHMGQSIAIGGDFNGDGITDIALGGYTRHPDTVPPTPETEVTRAFVFFGTGTNPPFSTSQITIEGDDSFDLLGWAVAFIDDLDGDGKDELAVTAPRADANGLIDSGRVYVFFGRANSATLTADTQADFSFDGLRPGAWFGASVAVVNNGAESPADILVGAPGRGPNGNGYAGCVFQIETPTVAEAAAIASGTSGIAPIAVNPNPGGAPGITGSLPTGYLLTAHRILSGSASGDRFGTSIAFVGNVDGQPGQEFLVGAPQYALEIESPNDTTGPGYVRLFSLDSATQIVQIDGSQDGPGEAFGFAVAGGLNIDNDGIPDLLVGSPLFDVHRGNPHAVRADAGRVRAFSGASAGAGEDPVEALLSADPPNETLMLGVGGSDQFGYAVAKVGQLDLIDSLDEFVVGAWKAPLEDWEVCAPQNGGDPRKFLGGSAYVFSPGKADPDIPLLVFFGEQVRDHLGRAVAAGEVFGVGSRPEVVLSGLAHSDDDFFPEEQEIGRGYIWDGTTVLLPDP